MSGRSCGFTPSHGKYVFNVSSVILWTSSTVLISFANLCRLGRVLLSIHSIFSNRWNIFSPFLSISSNSFSNNTLIVSFTNWSFSCFSSCFCSYFFLNKISASFSEISVKFPILLRFPTNFSSAILAKTKNNSLYQSDFLLKDSGVYSSNTLYSRCLAECLISSIFFWSSCVQLSNSSILLLKLAIKRILFFLFFWKSSTAFFVSAVFISSKSHSYVIWSYKSDSIILTLS